MGQLETYKGFDYLLRSGATLRRRGVECEILIIGDGHEKRSLSRLASELGIQDRVTFLGQMPFEQVRAAMGEATILVHPSNGIGDAVPTVIKEAMALGLPVVASDLVGIPELLDHGKCGRLVAPGNVEALAQAIEDLLADETLRLRYATAARRYAEETFDLWQNGARLAEVLRRSTRQ